MSLGLNFLIFRTEVDSKKWFWNYALKLRSEESLECLKDRKGRQRGCKPSKSLLLEREWLCLTFVPSFEKMSYMKTTGSIDLAVLPILSSMLYLLLYLHNNLESRIDKISSICQRTYREDQHLIKGCVTNQTALPILTPISFLGCLFPLHPPENINF